MKSSNYVAIMAGGVGSRFWPVSTTQCPKQFLDILGTGKTFIQSTFERFSAFIPAENIFVVTSESYVHLVQEQLPAIPEENILAEPFRRNTAPCIAYVSHKIQEINPEGNLIVAPSDHLIEDQESFQKNCLTALEFTSKNNAFVTFGIKPDHPNTGYGYIETEGSSDDILKVKRFTEKPDKETAKAFIQTDRFYWNSGIFIWKTQDIINSFEKYAKGINDLFLSISSSFNTPEEASSLQEIYEKCENISIDYAILEKATNVFMLPADFDWSDLGTWNSAWENFDKDEDQNAVSGEDTFMLESSDCIVHSSEKKIVVVGGMEDLIVVNTPDALLICKKENEQEIKKYVNQVKSIKGEAHF
ncbi:mannose-1-phosphate guanylyltransferase [Jiulongibacter sp. NS-SX5]|uniref:mannose-1-phosphate guanylyltransferase n=1 Tax=Jiulongibacter sp. NS-SX5 TaxID=3463854 RepID=UPI0040582FA6